ncbi:MAG: nickel pincer cofactor biosynthesis protein LarC [Candidatus Rokuibacteriota bacterium]
MRIAYFDCPAGASGDMILGALVDAGCAVGVIEEAVAALGTGSVNFEVRLVERAGLRGTHVVVATDPQIHYPDLAALLAPIRRSRLAGGTKERATAILTRLVEAESRVHRSPRETVHLHEVGALDTLVDVVGAIAGLDALGIGRVHVSPLPLGGGTLETAHGRLPVPAPATVELLRGFPVYDNGVRAELVTPTGAAILTTLGVTEPVPVMTLEAIGWGAGTRELSIPNLLRVLVGEAAAAPGPETETVAVVETTIDDMSPQLYEPLIEHLLAAGALDVYLTSVLMKRSRPGTVLTVLARPAELAELVALVFRETTTIGVRWQEMRRAVLPREMVRVETTVGSVTFKVSRLGGRAVTVTPEFEEMRRIARETARPLREVLEQVRAEGLRILGEPTQGQEE